MKTDTIYMYENQPVEAIPTIYGRNLFKDTKKFATLDNDDSVWTATAYPTAKAKNVWGLSNWASPNGDPVLVRHSAWYGLTQAQMLKPGTYTLSAWCYFEGNGATNVWLYPSSSEFGDIQGKKNIAPNVSLNKWIRLSGTFTVGGNGGVVAPRFEQTNDGDSFYIADMKLERGSHATPWTPAPENLIGGLSS